MLPPRLTRPLLIEERNQLINDLITNGFKIISIESNFVKYLMPPFEQYAFRDIDAIKTNPWRNGDVLIIQKQGSSIFKRPLANSIDKYIAYSRNDTKFRVFQKDNISFKDQKEEYIGIKEFESNVSTRKFDASEICVWTTSKRAIKNNKVHFRKMVRRIK
jgi:dGTPase